MANAHETEQDLSGVAIIGMAGRFPGAKNIDEFWNNLAQGVETIRHFTEEECIATGVDPALVKHPDYVKAWGAMDDIPLFDANYFGIPGREAEAMDPQHRHFMEVAATALDDAGYNPETYDGSIGVVSGVGISTYLLRHVLPHTDQLQSLGEYLVFIGNDKDFMPTRLSYKLNLRGPSHSVSTACSTTMVASHLAIQQLLTYQADISIAGGANLKLPQESGYLYRKGQLKSPDGKCRAFDKEARGTVFGNGVATLVFKRLEDAVADGDHIYAVIKGTAINNDGSSKAGYTAPSVKGQSECIAEAHEMAGFDPETITHIEAHGTGTELGDPVEIKALNRVFGHVEKKQYIAMTSVKTNIGHLDNVAGAAGLISTALKLHHKQIPPSLNFTEPNPEINFADSAFYVNTKLQDWNPPAGVPRRACISSFGAGGTNGHMVLEEAPVRRASGASRAQQLLVLSAKTPSALNTYTANLADHLEKLSDAEFADAVYTMNHGRREFNHRRVTVVKDRTDAISVLRGEHPERLVDGIVGSETPEQTARMQELFKALAANPTGDALVSALKEMGKLWSEGANLDWVAFYEGETRNRLRMPTYPFESKKYWLDLPSSLDFYERVTKQNGGVEAAKPVTKEADTADWFYAPSWKRTTSVKTAPAADNRFTLIFADETGLGDKLAERLRAQGIDAITVKPGDDFEELSGNEFRILASDPDHYNGLFTHLRALKKEPSRLVYMWNLGESGDEASAFHHYAYALQGLAAQGYTHPLRVLSVSSDSCEVDGSENLVPEKAMVLGLSRVIGQEMRNASVTALDMNVPADGDEQDARLNDLMGELTGRNGEEIVALRAGRRWVQTFDKVRTERESGEAVVREEGVTLVTGGLGGVGMALAKSLAEQTKAKLVLLGRSELPAKSEWRTYLENNDDRTAARIRDVLALEELGAEVMVAAADVSDAQAMARVVAEAEARFGAVTGVVHAAGTPESGVLARKTKEEMAAGLAAKLDGTRVLDGLFADKPLDFFVLCSSLASVLGGFGQAVYASANNYLNALAVVRRREGKPYTSVMWDAWKEVGMAADMELPGDLQKWHEDRLERFGIAPAEGADVFFRAVEGDIADPAISTYDFLKRVEEKNNLLSDEASDAMDEALLAKNTYPRPEMSVPYRAPEDAVQEELVKIWSKHLGISGIGVDDDFFELGGDSLKGMNLVNRIEQGLGEVMHVDALFDTPTIGQLAEYLGEHYPEGVKRLAGDASAAPAAVPTEAGPSVTAEMIERVDAMIPRLTQPAGEATPKNKPAAFVLAPPRSGSTLLRVMLAGNKQLFAPPELLMLNYNTMKERSAAFSDTDDHWLEGLIVAIMNIKYRDAGHAQSYVDEAIKSGMTTKEFMAMVQGWIPERLLVDKTPSYAYDKNVLERMEADYDRARFVHLIRHPYATVKSYVDAKMDLLLRRFAGGKLTLTSREIAEIMYVVCHRNILSFLETIPAERKTTVRFEDLVARPEDEAKRISDFLGVDYDPDMVNPYKEVRQRMTEGTRTGSKMIGDIKFHDFKKIDPAVADAWKASHTVDYLSDEAWTLSEQLGYVRENFAQGAELDVDNMSDEEVERMLRETE